MPLPIRIRRYPAVPDPVADGIRDGCRLN